ncbi:MAG: 30S ribosomal protein S4 [Candidatus Altiarchaeales archaeon]|nr:30S ribosomal protein S4 [Candidatus Altiarchaeota archaeon]MBU4342339.1 30S ribosomal protein S4 [Candidatus Altiarchaeota archaeon]MBU4437073.1 30S ribosomal protein S4 [Candidatus Altiarchaeota archaeon]MCG2783041.1 30S ribosomal protein S4 [Candidatus Altiarchaeales archaeon]
MGDPRKQRRKYERPTHPWKAERITEEKEICMKYGLKNRKELWRVKSKIRRFRQQARNLLASSGEEIMKEKKELFDKLKRVGILENPTIEDILVIKTEDLLDRRLQSQVCSSGLANTMKEARQLITHNHVIVGNRTINIPSYTVAKVEEDNITLKEGMRIIKLKRESESKKQVKKEEPEKEQTKEEPKAEEKEPKAVPKPEKKEEKPKEESKEKVKEKKPEEKESKEEKKPEKTEEPKKEEVKEESKEPKKEEEKEIDQGKKD